MGKKSIIGTNYMGYPYIRNIFLPYEKYEVHRFRDIYSILNSLAFFINNRTFVTVPESKKNVFQLWHNDLNLTKAEMFHLWNGISTGAKPWITSIEMPASFFMLSPGMERKLISGLAQDTCRKIFTLSQWAFDAQIDYLTKFPDLKETILGKMEVLLPPQKANINQVKKPSAEKPVTFMFVGRDFFRKGGKEIVRAFERLCEKKIPAHLIIISSLDLADYPADATEKDLSYVKSILAKYSDQITYYPELPNQKVLELMKSADVGLLPSYLETFGYTVLEFFSWGKPVITTNQRAFSEINSSDRGWIIELPFGNRIIKTIDRSNSKTRELVSELLTDQLFEVFCEIIRHRDVVFHKGEHALNYIRSYHDISRNISRISAEFDKILGR